jgi:hypothetical protein
MLPATCPGHAIRVGYIQFNACFAGTKKKDWCLNGYEDVGEDPITDFLESVNRESSLFTYYSHQIIKAGEAPVHCIWFLGVSVAVTKGG